MEKSKEKSPNKEGLKNNINREEQKEAVSKETEQIKKKYDKRGSHVDDGKDKRQEEGKEIPDVEHDDDDPQGVHLNRKSKKDQEVDIDSKDHLDEDEG